MYDYVLFENIFLRLFFQNSSASNDSIKIFLSQFCNKFVVESSCKQIPRVNDS